jgi:MHS family alpha-ketoglutarate permease-like MFS transporter
MWGAFFLIMSALIIVSGYTSINAVVKAELFPSEVRALGVGLPYALTVAVLEELQNILHFGLKKCGTLFLLVHYWLYFLFLCSIYQNERYKKTSTLDKD